MKSGRPLYVLFSENLRCNNTKVEYKYYKYKKGYRDDLKWELQLHQALSLMWWTCYIFQYPCARGFLSAFLFVALLFPGPSCTDKKEKSHNRSWQAINHTGITLVNCTSLQPNQNLHLVHQLSLKWGFTTCYKFNNAYFHPKQDQRQVLQRTDFVHLIRRSQSKRKVSLWKGNT